MEQAIGLTSLNTEEKLKDCTSLVSPLFCACALPTVKRIMVLNKEKIIIFFLMLLLLLSSSLLLLLYRIRP